MTVRWRLADRHRAALVASVASAIALAIGTGLELRWSSAVTRYSGYGLLTLMLVMCLLPLRRALSRSSSVLDEARMSQALRLHEAGAVLLPLALWVHAGSVNANGMLILAASVLLVTALGALHPSTRDPASLGCLRLWWRLHIVLVSVVLLGAVLHVQAMWAY